VMLSSRLRRDVDVIAPQVALSRPEIVIAAPHCGYPQ
jgi:hypothetical protein